MRISIRVKPNSKTGSVEKISDKEFVVRVKAPPHEGRANEAVIEALSGYFDVPRSRIAIVRGQTGKNKIADIL